MKTTALWIGLVLACVLTVTTNAQDITSFQENGLITWTNTDTNLFYSLEWQTDMNQTNSWRPDYTPLIDMRSTAATISVQAPMFFRVAGNAQPHIPDTTNVRAGTVVQGVLGTFWEGDRFGFGPDTNTIVDVKTRLMWPRNLKLAGANGYKTNWAGAFAFCEDYSLAELEDWRMPTREELRSIMEADNMGAFARDDLNGNRAPFVPLPVNDYFWSSQESGSTALKVQIRSGAETYDSKDATDVNVLPVRDIAP